MVRSEARPGGHTLSTRDAISNAYDSGEPIRREQVLSWIDEGDLASWGLLYTLTRDASNRIEPRLGMRATCDFLLNYYLRCILEGPERGPDIHSRFEAAYELLDWLKHVSSLGSEGRGFLPTIAERVTEVFLGASPEARNAIETGFLEHALENPEFVTLFEHWRDHPDLAEPYAQCLEWGLAHRAKAPREPA